MLLKVGRQSSNLGPLDFVHECREARKCLAGKKLLFVGDTQQLAQYATTLAYLSSTDECTLAEELGSSGIIPSIRCDKVRFLWWGSSMSAQSDLSVQPLRRLCLNCALLYCIWVSDFSYGDCAEPQAAEVLGMPCFCAYLQTRLAGATPFRPDVRGDKRVGVHHTEFSNGVGVTFYGTAVNGFAIGR